MLRRRSALAIGVLAALLLVGASFVYAHPGGTWGNVKKALGMGSPTEVRGSVLVAQDAPPKTGAKEEFGKNEVSRGSSEDQSEDQEEVDYPDGKSVSSDEKVKEETKTGKSEERKLEKNQERESTSERARAREQIRVTHEAKMQQILARARGTAVEEEILALPSLKLQELEAKLTDPGVQERFSEEEAKILREAIHEELQYLHRLLEVSL
ncbi:MAG: hypothetical protein IMX03_02745 [Brockia lithotrophica]|nr:hypothetical protein [Brockia lithotrophica]